MLQPAPAGDGPRVGPACPPPVTMQIVGAPGAGGLFGSAAAGRPVTTREQISMKGRTWTMALKEERVEVEVGTKGGGMVGKEEEWQDGAFLQTVKVESAEMGAVGQAEDEEATTTPREGGETCKPIYVKIELPTRVDSGMPLGSLKPSDGAGLWGPGSGTLLKVKRETAADEGTEAECEAAEDRQGPGTGTTAAEDGGAVFDSVEVEIPDEEIEGDEEAEGELHECVNCGKILLEADMVQHYMQHAMESDSPLQDCSPQIQPLSSSSPPTPAIPSLHSSPSVSPPVSPPTKRELRPQKKP